MYRWGRYARRGFVHRPSGVVAASGAPAGVSIVAASGFSASDYYDGSATDLPATAAMSVAALFRVTAFSAAEQAIFSRGNGGVDDWTLRMSPSGGAGVINGRIDNVSAPTRLLSAGDLDQWILMVVTYDGAAVRMYLNGTQIGSGTAKTGTPGSNTKRSAIGSIQRGTGVWAATGVDIAAAAYTGTDALSDAEVSTLWSDVETSGDIRASAWPASQPENLYSIAQGGGADPSTMETDQVGALDASEVGTGLTLVTDSNPTLYTP